MGSGERENKKWEQSREYVEMELLIRLVVRLGFVSIFHFPVPRVSNIIIDGFTTPHRYIYLLLFTGLNTCLD